MNKGKILLQREQKDFDAGFCIMKGELPNLIKDISLLHPNEHAYYNTLKFDRRRTSYLLGRMAAKKAISEIVKELKYQSISIDFGIFQYPVVKNIENIQVSISHCGNLGVALAFPEEHPIGVDIEKVEQKKIAAIEKQISFNEFKLMLDCNLSLPVGCTAIWTIKEGLSKIFKTGLTMDFSLLELKSIEKVNSVYLSTFCHCAQYKAITYHSGDYVCSVILPKKTESELAHFWNAFTNNTLNLENEG